MSYNHATRQRLIENATLLWTLNEIPEKPKDNITLHEDDRTRQLTLERERQLADSFAFISASTDDMLRVMAVSVEEDADGSGVTIRLASNTGDLSSMKEALGGIAKTLEKASTRVDSRLTIRRELFTKIVVLDRLRILSRLRSRHAVVTRKTAGKPGLLALLNRTINDPSIRASKVAKVRTQTRQIVESFDDFENAYDVGDLTLSEERFVDVLTQAYDFDVSNLQSALQSSSLIDPNLATFLPQAIGKLGRYYGVMCDLIDAARSSQYTIFGRVTIEVLEEPVLDSRSIIKGLLDFDGTLKRITNLSHQRHLNRYGLEARALAETRYNARISSRHPPWKIHAEIQLLFFYERNSGIPPPRFICSSKSACYLCDLFVKSHGRFRLPKTHGRLYDRWILPDWSVDQSLLRRSVQLAIDRCNTTLESKILQTLSTKRPPFHHPNESVLHLREPWSSNSTLPALEKRQSISETSKDGEGRVRKELDSADNRFSSEAAVEKRDVKSGETVRTAVPNSKVTNMQRSVSPSGPAVMFLSRGDTLCHRLTHACDTLVVRTDAITLHASWDWIPTGSTESASGAFIIQRDCWVRVNWLSHGSHITDGAQDLDIIDLETLNSVPGNCQEKTLEGGSVYGRTALCVQKGEHALVIQYYLEDPQLGQVPCSASLQIT